MFKKIAIVLILFVLVGCGTYAARIEENRAKISYINKGMSKYQVIQVMGNLTAKQGVNERFNNPYKTETIDCDKGASCEVYYYYTDFIDEDGKDWESGMTPIVFKDERVIGIGWRFLDPSTKTITIHSR